MITSKTVFIVGAGASAEAGLPVGGTLKQIIAGKLGIVHRDGGAKLGDPRIADYLRNASRDTSRPDFNTYLRCCRKIGEGIALCGSIDDFIDTHQHDPGVAICGKVAIAQAILEAERGSKLFFDEASGKESIETHRIADTWYQAFIELLTQGLRRTDVGSIFDNVTMVCFNYDRCIEHFLLHALVLRYAIPREEAIDVIKSLKIIHPYGMVGPYFSEPSEGPIPFGLEGIPPLKLITNNLRTYTEEVADKEALNAMQNAIAESEVAVFLGTAFHPNNMRLMAGGIGQPETKRVYATVAGISDENRQVVKDDITALFSKSSLQVNFAGTCSDLFNRYSMHLRL